MVSTSDDCDYCEGSVADPLEAEGINVIVLVPSSTYPYEHLRRL